MGGNRICQSKIFETLNSFYTCLDYQNKWLDDGLLDKLDFRFQTFARIEMHTIAYHLSIVSTKNDVENLINECLSLGYSLETAISSVGAMREVSLRISFWDRFFYTVEHFVQQMNAKYTFIDNTSTHSKKHYFQAMLDFFGVGQEVIRTKEIVKLFKENYPDKNSWLVSKIDGNLKDRDVRLSKLYEYAAALRNSLHNNGFSNKTLNNLDIGLCRFSGIKKGEFIDCLSVFHVLSLSLVITEALQRITQKSINMFPEDVIYDPFTKKLDDHVNNSNK